jgi:GDP-L-fucose synthase
MQKNSRIFVGGHRGLAGSAICRELTSRGFPKILVRTHSELDLADAASVEKLYAELKPDYVIVAAESVGRTITI